MHMQIQKNIYTHPHAHKKKPNWTNWKWIKSDTASGNVMYPDLNDMQNLPFQSVLEKEFVSYESWQ